MPRLISGQAHTRLIELAGQGLRTTAIRRQLRAEGLTVSNQSVSDSLKAFRQIQQGRGTPTPEAVTRLRTPTGRGAAAFPPGRHYYYGFADVETWQNGVPTDRFDFPIFFMDKELISFERVDNILRDILDKSFSGKPVLFAEGLSQDELDESLAEMIDIYDYFVVVYSLQLTSIVRGF